MLGPQAVQTGHGHCHKDSLTRMFLKVQQTRHWNGTTDAFFVL